jgi:cytochrome o ubiquinol oxidase operon protein cyoD
MSEGTARQEDAAPGDPAPGVDQGEGDGSVLSYTVGLAFALSLTAASFIVSQSHLFWAPGLAVGLAVLAIAQMGVHLVFFLHIGSGPDNTNNVLALAFGVLIVTLVVSGSLWIMANLNSNMMPEGVMQEMQK